MAQREAVSHGYAGTSSPVLIVENSVPRHYLCFYAVLGDCEIMFGSESFDDNAITIPEGKMWEPNGALSADIYFRGNGSKLTVIW